MREGYTFLGWYTSSSGGKQVTNNTILELPANHTIYAQWDKIEAKKHKVVVDFILEDHIESQLYIVEDGKDLAVNLTIPHDMEITDIKIDDVSVGKVASYTLKNVTSDHRVSVYVTSIKEDSSPESPVISFKDIKPADWYNTPVNYAASEDLIIGYTDNTFRPKNNMQVSSFVLMN